MKFGSIVLFFFLILTQPAVAHTLQTDGTIGAVLHISPEDDPIAGDISSFFFEIKDTADNFTSRLCECTVTIEKNSKILLTQPVFQDTNEDNQTNLTMIYTFPETGIYKITLTGKPLSGTTFNEFTLSYDVRVTKTIEDPKNSGVGSSTLSLIAIPIGLLLISIIVIGIIKKYRTNLKGGDKL